MSVSKVKCYITILLLIKCSMKMYLRVTIVHSMCVSPTYCGPLVLDPKYEHAHVVP